MTELLDTEAPSRTTSFFAETIGLSADETRSALLEEVLRDEPFSTSFSSTALIDEPVVAGYFANAVIDEGWRTPTLTEALPRRTLSARRLGAGGGESPVNRSASDRVVLLARKYVAKSHFTDEEKARLAILTERLRSLMPAVTVQESQSLVESLQRLESFGESDKEIRASLGLD